MSDYLLPEWGNIRFFAGATPKASLDGKDIQGTRFGAAGPSTFPTRFALGTARVWGIGFLPLGWARFVNQPASQFANRLMDAASEKAFRKFAPLEDLLCDPDADQTEQFDGIVSFLRGLMSPHRNEPKILRVHSALMEPTLTTVADFAKRADMSVRSLERVCARHFGFPPKLLIRRQRFMRSLTEFMLQRDSKWTDVLDDAYHDQAQFSREFRVFMGTTPREFVAQDHPFLTSFMEARARSLGSAALTLDPPD